MKIYPGGSPLLPLPAIYCLTLILLANLSLSPSAAHAQSLTSIAITPAAPSVAIGGNLQLHLTATYSNGASVAINSGAAWSTTDPRIGRVSSSGLATGIATGKAGIIATYQGLTAKAVLVSAIANVQWSGPLVITSGGTYSGNWRSTSPSTAAVTVATTQPVVIENSQIMGPADLINDPYYGNNLTVKNVIGIGTNPNIYGVGYGMFVDAQNPVLLDVQNCYFENVTYGIWVRGYAGNRDGVQTITLLNNRGRDMIGSLSNGNNGLLPGNLYWTWAHAIQLSNVFQVPGIRIAWNEIINYPYASLVNENINMYDSGGTSSSPAEVHDNFVQGAYPYDPVNGGYNGGGFTTDGSAADTVETASAFINIYDNQMVGTVNMGIEIGTGHDNAAYNNTVISSGLLSNGAKISAQNVGIVLYDVYGNIANGSMYNDNMYNNTLGWMCWAARCAWDGYRADDYFPDNPGYYATNTSISTDPITLQMETKQYTTWMSKVAGNNVVVGYTK
jgi:Bacterial Ig-like domain (group 2)